MSPLAAIAFGFALIVLGVAFLRRHRQTWRERKNDPNVDHAERTYYHRQYRRRMLTSGLLVALGVLIPLGDQLLERRFPLATVTFYWMAVLSLVLFVLLLGVVDFFATGMHTKDAILRVQGEKAALERQVEEVRRAIREGRSSEASPPSPPPKPNGRLSDHRTFEPRGRE